MRAFRDELDFSLERGKHMPCQRKEKNFPEKQEFVILCCSFSSLDRVGNKGKFPGEILRSVGLLFPLPLSVFPHFLVEKEASMFQNWKDQSFPQNSFANPGAKFPFPLWNCGVKTSAGSHRLLCLENLVPSKFRGYSWINVLLLEKSLLAL